MKITLYERYVLSLLLVREETQTNAKIDYMYNVTDHVFEEVFEDELRSLEKKGFIEISNGEWFINPAKIAMIKSWFMQIKKMNNYKTIDLLSNIDMSINELEKRSDVDNMMYQALVVQIVNSLKNKIKQ